MIDNELHIEAAVWGGPHELVFWPLKKKKKKMKKSNS